MSGADFSFEDAGSAPADPNSLDLLHEKLNEAVELKSVIDQMEADLGAAKKQLNSLNTQVVPDIMAELQMDELVFRGWKVKVGEFVSGSLPKDPEKRSIAIHWLEEHEGGDLIKTSLSVIFSRSQHNEALALAAGIEQQGFAPSVDSTVHPQTLMAWARERMKNGELVDPETLGLFTGRVAKFSPVKER